MKPCLVTIGADEYMRYLPGVRLEAWAAILRRRRWRCAAELWSTLCCFLWSEWTEANKKSTVKGFLLKSSPLQLWQIINIRDFSSRSSYAEVTLYLSVSVPVLTLLSDPVNSVEVFIGAQSRDWVLQWVHKFTGAIAIHTSSAVMFLMASWEGWKRRKRDPGINILSYKSPVFCLLPRCYCFVVSKIWHYCILLCRLELFFTELFVVRRGL